MPDFRGSQAYNAVYAKLVEAAKNKATVTYVDLSIVAGLPSRGEHMAQTLNAILREVMVENINKQEPLLPALVLKRGDTLPGNGFFMTAGSLLGISFKSEDDKAIFWEDKVKQAYIYWE